MKLLFILTLLFSLQTADAQLGRRLKDKVKQTAERKADQKTDEVINKGADKIDSIITGKKRDPKSDKSNTEKEVIESTPDNSTTENNEGSGNVENTFKEVIIKTNIRCETGKKKIETMLRNTDGVISAMIDNDNGNLYLSQENSDVRNKVIEIVRQNGFEADTKKPTKSIPDPCK